ncbi:MAG: alpha/beta hydrolase [Polyangiales bacterium]
MGRACRRIIVALITLLVAMHASAGPLDAMAVRIAPLDRTVKKPLFVFLHGMCEDAANVCPKYGAAVASRGWLVCPRATVACKGGGATWTKGDREPNVIYGIESAMLADPGKIDTHGGVMIGWSLGAAVALDLATRQIGWWKGLVLVSSMTIEPDVEELRAAGIERVVLAAGDLDASRPHMLEVERRLRELGMKTKFVSLGKVGHVYPSDLASRMGPALGWVSGEES